MQALVDLQAVQEVLGTKGLLLEMLLAMTDPAAGVPKTALTSLLLEPLRAFGADNPLGSDRFIIDNPLYLELLQVRRCASLHCLQTVAQA